MTKYSRLAKCRNKLIETARAESTITYGALSAHIGLKFARNIGIYLNPLYEEEMKAGRPDLTLVAVSAKTGYGRFNSKGKPPRSVRFNPSDPAQLASYKTELKRVYKTWKTKPSLH